MATWPARSRGSFEPLHDADGLEMELAYTVGIRNASAPAHRLRLKWVRVQSVQ